MGIINGHALSGVQAIGSLTTIKLDLHVCRFLN